MRVRRTHPGRLDPIQGRQQPLEVSIRSMYASRLRERAQAAHRLRRQHRDARGASGDARLPCARRCGCSSERRQRRSERDSRPSSPQLSSVSLSMYAAAAAAAAPHAPVASRSWNSPCRGEQWRREERKRAHVARTPTERRVHFLICSLLLLLLLHQWRWQRRQSSIIRMAFGRTTPAAAAAARHPVPMAERVTDPASPD